MAGQVRGARAREAVARADEGFVATPADLATRMVDLADLAGMPEGTSVLEPSAGDGAIVRAVTAVNPQVKVWAIEPNRGRAAALKALPGVYAGREGTFEEYHAFVVGSGSAKFDRVLMNPPFWLPGNTTVWIDHVRMAWDLLAPAGRLVAIVAAGLGFRGDRRHRELRELVEEHGGWEKLPVGTFAKSGTDVSAVLLWADKPVPDAPPLWAFRAYSGEEVPARVGEPQVHAGAPTVQVWRSPWTGTDRILRLWGRCAVCPRLVWGFDGGENDVRGPLGWNGGGWSLDPFEYEAIGPKVALCVECADSAGTHEKGKAVARRYWTPAGPEGASTEGPPLQC